jgi:hypothetical protein
MSIDVNPYTAFVGWPVEVEKFSTGSAKKARYASECPSSSRRRCGPCGTIGAAADGAGDPVAVGVEEGVTGPA